MKEKEIFSIHKPINQKCLIFEIKPYKKENINKSKHQNNQKCNHKTNSKMLSLEKVKNNKTQKDKMTIKA